MKNLEIKAKVKSIKEYERIFKKLGAKFIHRSHQIDTYFEVPKGRLKLRKWSAKGSALIYYERKETSRRRWSEYFTFSISEPDKFKQFFKKALPVKIVVDKVRFLYRYKNAKIHLDKVSGLGEFIEIEVEVTKGPVQARKLMAGILSYLHLPQKNFIKKSYSDLVVRKKK